MYSLAMLGLVSFGLPTMTNMLPRNASLTLKEMRTDSYARIDPFTQMQSYYEDLNTATPQAGPLLSSLRADDVDVRNAGSDFAKITRRSDPVSEIELLPGWQGVLDGHRTTINQFGMRDRKSITIAKPENTWRIAVVGSSVVMGYSVHDGETLCDVLETQLNAASDGKSPHVEVLNFGTGRQWALHRRALVDRKVLAFRPDVLVYFAHQDEFTGPVNHLSGLISEGRSSGFPELDQLFTDQGLIPEMPRGVLKSRISNPLRVKLIVAAIYRNLTEVCQLHGIIPVWAYLPIPGAPNAPDLSDTLPKIAADAGFEVIDLSGWYGNRKLSDIKPREADIHLNQLGHQLVGELLTEHFLRRNRLLPQSMLTGAP